MINKSFFQRMLQVLFTTFAFTTVVSYTPIEQPIQPIAYPSTSDMISGDFLLDPIVTDALEYIKSTVSARLLAIAPSRYQPETPNQPIYNSNEISNCYWPTTHCYRTQDTSDFYADITTCPNDNEWGLTYDDGPIPETLGLLSVLQEKNIKATFYVTGLQAFRYQEILKQEYIQGHEIAIHSWTHHPLTSLSNDQIIAELLYTEAIIHKITGQAPLQYRPPYGDVDDRVRAIASALGFRTVYWSHDSGDSYKTDTNNILDEISSWYTPGPGMISLQHDISAFTTNIATIALNAMLDSVKKPMTVGACLGIPIPKNTGIPNNKTECDTLSEPTEPTKVPVTTEIEPTPCETDTDKDTENARNVEQNSAQTVRVFGFWVLVFLTN